MDLQLLIAELRRDEGVRYTPYLDTRGIQTVGIGHNLTTSPLPAGWTAPITDDQVDQLLEHDLAVTFAFLDLHLPWWRGLDDVRERVIANMAFNMNTRLLTFHNSLAAVQRGDYVAAAAGMLQSDWARQVGARAKRLAAAMRTGAMPS